MNNNYYVYIHVLENNTPFYVGLGQNKRALSISGRTNSWKKLYNNKCKYAIIKENLSLFEANILEKELITKYGKLCDNTGTLVNIQNGGLCPNIDYYLNTSIYSLDLLGNIIKEYNNIKEAQDLDNFKMSAIKQCLMGKRTTYIGYQFIKQQNYINSINHIHKSILINNNKVKIPITAIKKTKWHTIVVKKYEDIKDVINDNYSINAVKLCLKEPKRKHKNLYWIKTE